jgi:hypothetical protein
MFQRVSLQKAQTQRFQYYLSTRGFVFVKKCLDKINTRKGESLIQRVKVNIIHRLVYTLDTC